MTGNISFTQDSEASNKYRGVVTSFDVSRIGEVTGGSFILAQQSFINLHTALQFTEIRMRCFKPYHGRTIDVVIPYNFILPILVTGAKSYIDDTSRFLPDDTSKIKPARQLIQVYGLYNHAIYVERLYHCLLYTSPSPRDS